MLDRALNKMPFKVTDVLYIPGAKEILFSTQVMMYSDNKGKRYRVTRLFAAGGDPGEKNTGCGLTFHGP